MATSSRLSDLTERLLEKDAAVHADALEALREEGDERVIPHLVELEMIHAIGSEWERFGFPEVLRDRAPPRYLELPEARWPGVEETLGAIAEPDFDSAHAWVEWETWYSQQGIDPLDGFEEWKLSLYRRYLPPVGSLLAAAPREFDVQDVRWGNCDPSFLAALNGPSFLPADDADYVDDDHLVFGFELAGQAYAVPRYVLFPHELLNARIDGHPVSLTYCTLCNAPILYDRRVDGETLTFGSTGMLLSGNKVMFDEETDSLWSQHRGVPLAGEHLEREASLDARAVTQADWGDWRAEHPETLVLDIDTGYDFDYSAYDGDVGFFTHYWNDESAVQPGVRSDDDRLPEKASVYGYAPDDETAWVFPVERVRERGALTATADGRRLVALRDATDDVALYEAPSESVAYDRDEGVLGDESGTEWTVTYDALVAADGRRLERVDGRHGLWFAFRTGYDETHVVGE